jgi:hypothetical protein
MRDGIHKTLPMAPAYRRLVRACTREADRGENARGLAERALMLDLRRCELSDEFWRTLRRWATEGSDELPGLSRLAMCESSRDAGGRNSPFENLLLDQAQRLERAGECGDALVLGALTAALGRWRERQARQVEQHIRSKLGGSARPTDFAARDALLSADVQSIARGFLEPDKSAVRSRVRTPLDLDEDLARLR